MAVGAGAPDIRVRMTPTGLSEVLGALAAVRNAAIGVAAVGGPVLLIANTLEAIDAQLKLARTLGATSEGLAVLQRAAGLAGVEQEKISRATAQLDVMLGKAIQGEDKATEAFDRLGLSAAALSKLDVDNRIEAINEALLRNVPASERAAVAAEIFGAKMRNALKLIDPETMATAREEVEALGLAVAEVDATTIERTRDQLSSLSGAAQGAANRFAVLLAPALDDISRRLRRAAIDARGFENEIELGFDVAIRMIGLFGDGIRGLQFIFKGLQLAGQETFAFIIEMMAKIPESMADIIDNVIGKVNFLIRALNLLPGVDISEIVIVGHREMEKQIREIADSVRATAQTTREELQALAEQPLPSDSLRRWFDEVRGTAREASEETVRARRAAEEGGGPGRVIDKEAQRRLDRLRESLLSEADAERVAHAARLRDLNEFLRKRLLSTEEFNQLVLLETAKHEENLRAIQAKQEEPWRRIQQARIDDLKGLQEYIMSEEELEAARHARRLEQLVAAAEETNMTEEEYRRLREELELKHQAAMGDIAAQGVLARRKFEAMNLRQQAQTIFGELANITAGVAQHNRTLFNINKVAGIANAILNAYVGISKSLAAYPMPLAAIMAGIHAAAAFAQVSAIRATTFGGGAGAAPSIAGATPATPVTPVTSGAPGGPGGGGQTTIIQFRGSTSDEKLIRRFVEMLNENSRDGGRLIVA